MLLAIALIRPVPDYSTLPQSSHDLSNIRTFYGGIKVPHSPVSHNGFEKFVLVLSIHDIEGLVQFQQCVNPRAEISTYQ